MPLYLTEWVVSKARRGVSPLLSPTNLTTLASLPVTGQGDLADLYSSL